MDRPGGPPHLVRTVHTIADRVNELMTSNDEQVLLVNDLSRAASTARPGSPSGSHVDVPSPITADTEGGDRVMADKTASDVPVRALYAVPEAMVLLSLSRTQ